MLLKPCRKCLVKPSCSSICDEKRAWDFRLDLALLSAILILLIIICVILISIYGVLVLLHRFGVISDETLDRLRIIRDEICDFY